MFPQAASHRVKYFFGGLRIHWFQKEISKYMRFLDHIEKWKIGLLITLSQEGKAVVSRAKEKKTTNEKYRNPGAAGRRISHGCTKYKNLPPIFCQKTLNDLIQHVILALQNMGFWGGLFSPFMPLCVFLSSLPGSSFPRYL